MIGLAPRIMTPYPDGDIFFSPDKRLPTSWKRRIVQYTAKCRRLCEKLAGSAAWRKTSHSFDTALEAFTLHPAETHESYLQHLWFTFKTSLRFVFVGIMLLTHGIFPFLFTRTASSQIERLYLLMRSRVPKARRAIIDIEYDI